MKPYALQRRDLITAYYVAVEEITWGGVLVAVRAITRPLVMPGLSFGAVDCLIPLQQLPDGATPRYEPANRPLQSVIDDIRSAMLTHGGTLDAVRLLCNLEPLSKKEFEMAKAKLSNKAAKTEAPTEEKAPAAAPKAKGKGNAEALAKAREAKAASSGPDTRKIKITNKENPYREGSNRAASFDALKGAKTVQDYLDAGGKAKYLSRWADEERITLG